MKPLDIIYNKVWRYVLLSVVLMAGVMVHAAKREELLASFTKDHPLVVITLHNNAPYEFSDSEKLSNGYNPEMLMAIVERLGIECKMVAMDWAHAKVEFESGKADLMMAPDDISFEGDVVRGHSIIAPVHVGVAYSKSMGELEDFNQMIPGIPVYSSHTGVTLNRMVAAGLDTSGIEYAKTADILEEFYSGARGYLLGNDLSMNFWIKRQKYGAAISVTRLPLAASGVNFCSHNPVLVSILDEEFGRLEQQGVIEELQIKWFYPERERTDFRGWAYGALVVAAVMFLIVMFLNRIVMLRTHTHSVRLRKAASMMEAAIKLDGREVISFDFKEMEVKNISGHFLPDAGMLPEQYLEHVHPDDRPLVYAHMHHMSTSDSSEVFNSPMYRWNSDGNPDGPWRMIMLQSVFEFTPEGLRTMVVSTVSDVTKEMERSQEEEDTAEMFYKIFDNGVLGMAIYSPAGELQEGNKRMYEIFHIPTDEQSPGYFYGNNLYKMPSLQGVLDPVNPQELWVCSAIHPGSWNKKAFIELHITPVHDDSGKLVFLLVSVRDITDDVNTYRERKDELQKLHAADSLLQQREDELRILLQSARMRLWIVSAVHRTISFYHSPGAPEKVMTWDEFLELAADEKSRSNMERVLNNDMSVFFSDTVRAAINNLLGTYDTPQWYALNVLGRNPMNEDGEETLFGLALNITASVEAQRTFEAEKKRATESEHQKTVFLNSMAHEIRTPLNSIVGFSEVLPMLEDAERDFIIDTIKKNCDKLLRLTDDLLTISAMDAREVKFHYEDIDFSKAFDEEFEHLRMYTDPNSPVQYVKDNPCESLMVRIDMRRISQILTNFLCNAVKYTSAGYIKLGYSFDNKMLRIYCQDTGSGISKERQAAVFERFFKVNSFVQGMGMGLAVCKAIAEAMGGHVGVESEEGKGSTFYVEIPQNGGGVILL